MSLPPATFIGGTRLRVGDLARSLAFYRDVLGFTATPVSENVTALAAGSAAPILTLVEQKDAVRKPPRSTGLYHAAILTPSRPALGKVLRRLFDAQYPLDGASDHLVSEALYLSDPDGNGLEIYRDRPRGEWRYAGTQLQMDTRRLDLESLLNDADPSAYTAIPDGTVIGHMHLHVSDLAQAEAFYAGLLGFDVVVRGYPGALFFSAGGYHHHLGTNTWAGSAPPPPNAVGMVWWDLVVPGGAAAVIERITAAGIPASISATGAALVADRDGNYVRILNE